MLEIGTANGFVCFEMERRGAEVVGFDLDTNLSYDSLLPQDDEQRRAQAAGIQEIKNAYWLAHNLLGSEARMVYGHANALPDELGSFDVAIVANVLQHLADPIGALLQAARKAQSVIVTETDWMRNIADDLPAMLLFEPPMPFSWYQVKPMLVEAILARAGFSTSARTEHLQPYTHQGTERMVPHYTIVASRSEK